MNNEHKNIIYTAADIEKYYAGSLSAAEMHQLEKAALDDPFLAEAMEGYAGMNDQEWKKHLAIARQQVAEAGTAKVVAMHKPAARWWKAAAAILVIGAGATLTFMFTGRNNVDTDQVAEAKQTPQTETAKSEKIPDTAQTSPASAVAEQPGPTPIASTNSSSGQKASAPIAKTENGNGSTLDDNFISRKTKTPLTDSIKPSNSDFAYKTQDSKAAGIITTQTVPASPGYSGVEKNAAPAKSKEVTAADNDVAAMQRYRSANAASAKRSPTNFFNAQVLGPDNTPLPFSNISVKSGNFETYADVRGNFRLFSTDSLLTVEIKSIGYQPRSFSLRSNQLLNKIVLAENEQALAGRAETASNADNNRIRRASVMRDTAINVEPKDGWDNYNTYVANNIEIPEEIIKEESHGEVELSFDVEANGTITNIRVNKSLGPVYDEAAKRLIKQGPQWKVKKGRKTSASVKVKF